MSTAQNSKNTGVFVSSFNNMDNETSSFGLGYVHQNFRQPQMYFEFSPVLPEMVGKQPTAGQKMYNYDARQFVTLDQDNAALFADAINKVLSGTSKEEKITLGGNKAIGVAQASIFAGISNPVDSIAIYMTVGTEFEIVHAMVKGKSPLLNLLYSLVDGYRQVVCVQTQVVGMVRNLTKTTTATPGSTGQQLMASSRRTVTANDANIPSGSGSVLGNFTNATANKTTQSPNVSGEDLKF